MKSALLFVVLVALAGRIAPAAPAPWGKGCDTALLDGEFSLAKAPALPSGQEQQAYIERVIAEMKRGYGGTIVTTEAPHAQLDTPEFVSAYLRAFGELGDHPGDYDYRFERLLARLSATATPLDDARLDWDLWRAWLLLENHALESYEYEGPRIQGARVMNHLDSARDLLWLYLDHNAPAILKDEKRRAWWIAQLTRDLEAPGGRPSRRWFLPPLIAASDTQRPELERQLPTKLPRRYSLDHDETLREPHPLDPFLVLEKRPAPPFAEALWQLASPLGLTLEELRPRARGAAGNPSPDDESHPVQVLIVDLDGPVGRDQPGKLVEGLGRPRVGRTLQPSDRPARERLQCLLPTGESRWRLLLRVPEAALRSGQKRRWMRRSSRCWIHSGLIDAAARAALTERGIKPLPVRLVAGRSRREELHISRLQTPLWTAPFLHGTAKNRCVHVPHARSQIIISPSYEPLANVCVPRGKASDCTLARWP